MTINTPTTNYSKEELEELTELLHLLSSPRRVRILEVLRENPSISRLELVTKIAELEHPDGRQTGARRKRILISTYQQHLPSMSSMPSIDVINWCRESDEVTRGDDYDQVIETLDHASLVFHRHA